MALSIKTSEADELARELARLTRESLTEAVTIALRERLERIRRGAAIDVAHSIERVSIEFREHARDDRSADEIIGYDEHGLPA